MRNYWLLVLGAILGLAMMSCRLAERAAQGDGDATAAPPAVESTAPAVIPASPSPPAAGNVLFTQTFDAPAVSGWDTQTIRDEYGQVQRDLFEGSYRWRITALQGVFAWMYPDLPVEVPASEFYYAVTVRLGDAPADVAYGPLFGVRDGGSLYYFKVSGLGEYALYIRSNNSFTALIDETVSSNINTGPQASNRLAVERSQGVVRLYANEQVLAEIPLPAAPGTVGLAAELRTGQSGMLFFDDVILCRTRCP